MAFLQIWHTLFCLAHLSWQHLCSETMQFLSIIFTFSRYHVFSISTIEFSCAVGSRDNTLRIWNVQTAHTIQILEGHEYQVRHVLSNFAFATSSIVNRQTGKGYTAAKRLLLPCCKCLLMDKCCYAAGYWCDCTSRWVYCLLCS